MTASKKVLVSLSVSTMLVVLVSLVAHMRTDVKTTDIFKWGNVIGKRFNDTAGQCQIRMSGIGSGDVLDTNEWMTSSNYMNADFCKLEINDEVKIFLKGELK